MKRYSAFAEHLEAAGLELATDAAGFERFREFFELRARWARTHNLSGPSALARPWAADALDGAALAQVADAELTMVDVGSGSGVPGLLFACLRPDHGVVLVEPRVKRVAFLRTAIRSLGLNRVKVVRGRWPMSLGQSIQVVSRAVVSPAEWPQLAATPEAEAVVRFLAAERPAFEAEGFELATAVDYRVEDADRRAERWIRRRAPAS